MFQDHYFEVLHMAKSFSYAKDRLREAFENVQKNSEAYVEDSIMNEEFFL